MPRFEALEDDFVVGEDIEQIKYQVSNNANRIHFGEFNRK
jgi:hypothetical protein